MDCSPQPCPTMPSTTNDSPLKPLHSLHGLQGLAVLFVFAYNYGTYGSTDVFEQFSNNGRVAVSFFFVASGFIQVCMSGHCEMKSQSSCRVAFWAKRWLRLMPAYMFALVLNLSDVRSLWRDQIHFGSTPAAQARKWADILSHIFGISTWLPLSSIVWNPVSWYVQTELCFYFLFPHLLKLHRRIISKRGWRGWTELLAFYTLFSWSITLAIAFGSHGLVPISSQLNHLPWIRFPEFAIGMLFGSLHKVKMAASARNAVTAADRQGHDENTECMEQQEEEGEVGEKEQLPELEAFGLDAKLVESIPSLAEAFMRFAEKRCDVILVFTAAVILTAGLSDLASDWCAFGVLSSLLGVCVYSLAANETSSNADLSKIVGRFLSTKLLQNMGELAYCFYLVHFSWPSIFIWFGYHVPPTHTPTATVASFDLLAHESPNLAWPYFILSIGAAFIMHEAIEAPIYVAACKWLHRRSMTCNCPHGNFQQRRQFHHSVGNSTSVGLGVCSVRGERQFVSPTNTPQTASEWELELLIEDQRSPLNEIEDS